MPGAKDAENFTDGKRTSSLVRKANQKVPLRKEETILILYN